MGGMSWLFREPGHDPELTAALSRLDAQPDPNRAEPLRQRIMAGARPRLAELRAPTPHWWEWISRWMPVAVPVGLAASLAVGVLLPRSGEVANFAAYTADAGADSTLVLAAFSERSAAGQLAIHLIAPEDNDWLLEQAVIQ